MKYSLIPFASLFILSSCAWYKNLERSLVEDEKREARRSQTVSREQYDQLLVKYEELSKKYEELKEKPAESGLLNELQKTQGENFSQNSQVETETVNLFPGENNQNALIQVPSGIEDQLNLYRRAVALKGTNPGEATKIFQQLENKAIAPVKVRAKFQVGDMLLARQQYDLALQVFEDIITKHAQSGVVLDALKGAVVASDKLGIGNKRDQYSSMLNDVFGSTQGM